ncbi:type II toxin-antitoxin system RelE family toxin [Pararhizobium capsulatum]|uniref:type II toxin-antitoxin system RelE family toxin n=1 Tax=Pararhizobium capsulatum TaxID=34014 RepID=UPI0027D8234E|nr:type II toxin-antitoxin system RelE/ParE family toxin [Pararhizobium capsulatum]
MAWTIEISDVAERSLKKVSSSDAQRIVDFLYRRVLAMDNPRQLGQALQGSKLGDLWRYRVGDFRILCRLQDQRLVILVVEIGHRRDVYR